MSEVISLDGVVVAADAVRESAKFIRENFTGHFVSWDAFRFCLELYRRALFTPFPIISPSLEFGIEDGFASYFRHRDEQSIDFGAELPSGASLESFGISPSIHFDHFKNLIGMDLCAMPFADNTFASISISHALSSGQNLERLFSEILRVLAPGGGCTYACDIDQWLKFKELNRWLHEVNPKVSLYSKEYHLELLQRIGAVKIQYRTFFPAALESVLVGVMNTMPASFRTTLATEIGHGGEVDQLASMMDDVFCTLIEQELSRPVGPEDAFHIFVTFKKAGSLPLDLPVPLPVCAICHSQVSLADISSKVCVACGEHYSVHAGVPLMVRSDHPLYSNSNLREQAAGLAKAADSALTTVLPQLATGPFYVIYDGVSPVAGLKAPNILTSFLQFHEIAISGIIALNVASDLNFKGFPIVQLEDLPSDVKLVLFTADRHQPARWLAKLREHGVKGNFYAIHWDEGVIPSLKILAV